MRYITFKSNVRLKRWTPALAKLFDVLHDIQNSNRWLPDLVITSVNDSEHSKQPLSRHYTDEAIDIRTHNFTNDIDLNHFIEILKGILEVGDSKGKFTVILESEGTPNEHIHVQVKKGKKFP